MNLLIVSQHFYPENFRVTDIAEELVKRGNSVTVVCGYPNYPDGVIPEEYKGKKHKDEIINGVHVMRCFEIARGHNHLKLFLNYYSVCLSMKFKARHLKEHFDCVMINETSPIMVAWGGIAYAKKNKVPCVMYCYDLWPDCLAAGGIKENSIIFKYFFKVSKKIYQSMDYILCTSKLFIGHLENKFGIAPNKLSYLPQYCEDVFNDVSEEKHDGFNFVFAGNIGKVQSVETIIKAASLLKDENIKIHIVGDGSNLENCKKLASGLDNVIFYGKRPMEEMPKFYSMADAMLLTLSKNKVISYTLPGKVQSYMAAGKAIIASIDGEANQLIQDAKCGLVCGAEDDKKLAELMANFKNEDIKTMAKNSKKYYQDHFSKNTFFQSLLQKLSEQI